MTDSIRVIWEFLTAPNTQLYDLVSTRIWSPESPVTWKNETPGIVFELLDEERGGQPKNSSLILFRCYGGKKSNGNDYSHDDARRVYLALHDRIAEADGVSTDSGKILMAIQTTGAQTFGEDDTEWPVVEAQYRFEIE